MVLYDSSSRQKVELPAPPGPIGMYVCGPTVYQRIHIGNARPFVVSMWMRQWLSERGYEVKLVENITDINDKIYEAAARQKMKSAELAEQAARWYIEDTDELGLGRPDVEPRATDVIPEIVALIGELIDRGLAYESGGDVYFRVPEYPAYGELSGAQPDEMIAQEPGDLKEDARDFALWKATKAHEDTQWDSPWGPGRPGWHIECSAMAEKHLGPEFEIHGGGLDLRFPHHENELAQSRGAGRPFARHWAHNGMLQLAEEKMSKSVGNIVSLREVLDTYGREAILVFFLSGHYRGPLDYSDEAMEAARSEWDTFSNAFRTPQPGRIEGRWEDLINVLDDDFNTPKALSILHGWRRDGEIALLRRGLSLFGLNPRTPQVIQIEPAIERDEALPLAVQKGRARYLGNPPPHEVSSLAAQRDRARLNGDFEEADRLRGEIAALGFQVDDLPDGYVIVPIERERHPRHPD